jgi:hypothetical protein
MSAKIAAKRMKHEGEKEAISLFEKSMMASLSFVGSVSMEC